MSLGPKMPWIRRHRVASLTRDPTMKPTSALRVFLTQRGAEAPLAEQPRLPAAPAADASLPRLVVNTERRFQTHLGFGGAFTEAAATVWQGLPEAAREQLLRDWFDQPAATATRWAGTSSSRITPGRSPRFIPRSWRPAWP